MENGVRLTPLSRDSRSPHEFSSMNHSRRTPALYMKPSASKTTQSGSMCAGIPALAPANLSLRSRCAGMICLSVPAPGRLVSALLRITMLAAAWGSAAHGAIISIHPSKDNSIYSESDNSNGLGELFAGQNALGDLRRALLQFDIAGSIPAWSIIDSVSLDLIPFRSKYSGKREHQCGCFFI